MRKEKEMMSLNRRRLVRIAAALTVTAALLAPALYGASPALSRTVSSAVIRTATFSSPALCADAGQSAAARIMDAAGAFCALGCAVPLLEEVIGLLRRWL